MSSQSRNPAARRMLAQGRVRTAVVVAGAGVLAAAGGAVEPALAQPAPPAAVAACGDVPTPPSVSVDGRTYDCAAVVSAPAPTATTPAKSSEATPTTLGPAGAPAPAPGRSHPSPLDHPERDGAATRPSLHDPKPTARTIAPRESEVPHGEVVDPQTLTAKADGTDADAPPPDTAGAPAQQGPESDAMVSYASLPASWTSLAPLSMPAETIDGFPIPPFLLPLYQAAAAQYGVPWEVLASINEIESNFGRDAGVSSAGALGFMQFISSSWARWGTDSDGDHRRDPRNPVDAIFAAARYLHDAGAGTDLPKAIFAYNHAGWYVEKVVARAREFAGLDPTLVAALTERALREDHVLYRAPGNPFAGAGAITPRAGQALLLTKRQLTRMVLRSHDIDIYAGGRQDIAAGHIDRRVLATLVFLARSGLRPTVSCLTSGHALLTTSGNISAHSYGHAVDISAINGIPIAGHQGLSSITATTLLRLVRLQGYLRPNQIISLMTVDGYANTLSMSDHADHIHVGFPRTPRIPGNVRPADIRALVARAARALAPPTRTRSPGAVRVMLRPKWRPTAF
jgi:soluble lytic murein transglycosylase-like protein